MTHCWTKPQWLLRLHALVAVQQQQQQQVATRRQQRLRGVSRWVACLK
jgi:hypothetical protein